MNHARGSTWTILVLMTVVAVPRAARGGTDPERASETPTTAPGESPRAALRAYNAAMRAGDVDAIVALQHAANETEARVARVIAKSEVEVAGLLEAARAKFGDAGARSVGRAIGDISDADIDHCTETVTGDRAILRFPFGGAAPMVRVDGEWKSSVADMIRASGGTVPDAIERFTRRASFARAMAQEIASGKVKAVEDVVARVDRHERGMGDEDPPN